MTGANRLRARRVYRVTFSGKNGKGLVTHGSTQEHLSSRIFILVIFIVEKWC